MRYAQEKLGQKLHLVHERADGGVGLEALCGRYAAGGWRMTINVPLGHACRNCLRDYRLSPSLEPLPTIGLVMNVDIGC